MEPLTPLIAFGLGLVGSLHCIGMCGGVIGALTVSLDKSVHADRRRLLAYVFLFNAGRVASYVLAGGVVGVMSASLAGVASGVVGHAVVRALAAATLFATGMYLAGWFPALGHIERLGVPLWRRLEPAWRFLTPVGTPVHAFLFGVVWGALPCAMVYSVLAWSMWSGTPLDGMTVMAAYGLGTLPATVGTALFARLAIDLRAVKGVRRVLGPAVMALAVASLVHMGDLPWSAPAAAGEMRHCQAVVSMP